MFALPQTGQSDLYLPNAGMSNDSTYPVSQAGELMSLLHVKDKAGIKRTINIVNNIFWLTGFVSRVI